MSKDRFYDNTRLSSYKSCPRLYYLRHEMDWATEGMSPPLIFGLSWHSAMDRAWEELGGGSDLSDEEVANLAYGAFLDCWTSEGYLDPMDMATEEAEKLLPRHPSVALEMLYEYVAQRRVFLSNVEVLAIEKPFAVPLNPEDASLFYVGRFDKVFRHDGGFRASFVDSFSPNSQVDGYLHAAHMEYGDKVRGVWIDAALVHKTVHDRFQFIPIERQFAQLDSWLWETRQWIAQLEGNQQAADDYSETDKYLPAFPKNTNSCMNYAGCPYAIICKAWPNPMGRNIPSGFEVNPWSPFHVLGLSEIGLKE